MIPGQEIAIRIDQTPNPGLHRDYGLSAVRSHGSSQGKDQKSLSHISIITPFRQDLRNADDHKYIQTIASKHGIYFSRPGNGICHQVHLERV